MAQQNQQHDKQGTMGGSMDETSKTNAPGQSGTESGGAPKNTPGRAGEEGQKGGSM